MFLVSLGVGPDPICPFLILATTQPNRSWVADLTLAYINVLDPSAAVLLAPWFQITPSQTFKLPQDAGHPALALASNHLPGVAVSFCTQREYRAYFIIFSSPNFQLRAP